MGKSMSIPVSYKRLEKSIFLTDARISAKRRISPGKVDRIPREFTPRSETE
jgi:hypothetical protein